MASAMAYFQANRGKLSGQISANVVSSSRTSEGINYIKIQDISFEEKTVNLYHLKNRTQSVLPLASSVISMLKEYLKYRKGKPNDYLFCNTVGETTIH